MDEKVEVAILPVCFNSPERSIQKRCASIQMRRGAISLERRTAVMGVLNVTPDSFYDGGRLRDARQAVAHRLAMIEAGADIIDIGGESTRPGAEPVALQEELQRVLPVIRELRRATNAPLSIDTVKAAVAKAALGEGADMVNDISALRFDSDMVDLIAVERVPVVLMHMQGTPRTMQREPSYARCGERRRLDDLKLSGKNYIKASFVLLALFQDTG